MGRSLTFEQTEAAEDRTRRDLDASANNAKVTPLYSETLVIH